MSAPSIVPSSRRAHIGAARTLRARSYSGGAPAEVVEDGPSIAGRLAWLGARLTIRPTLTIGSHIPFVSWPFGLVDVAARALLPIPGTVRATIKLPNSTAALVRAKGVLPADG